MLGESAEISCTQQEMAFERGEESRKIFGCRGENLGANFESGDFDFFEGVVYFSTALKIQRIL